MVCPAMVRTSELWYEEAVPTTRFPENAKLIGVPEMVAAAPPGVSTVPAIETADGFEIVNSWPAAITVRKEAMGSKGAALGSEASLGLTVGSTFPNAL